MGDITVRTLEGRTTSLSAGALDALRGSLRGPLCLPGDDGYDEARTIWYSEPYCRRRSRVIACETAGSSSTVRLAGFATVRGSATRAGR